MIWILVWLIPMLGLLWVLYTVATYPLRKRERTRLFLDLLATGLREGRSIEQTIVSASDTHDKELGARFHLLGAYLEQGLRFHAALHVVETGLPGPIRAVLANGLEVVGLDKILPAARRMLNDASSRAHSSINYMLLVLMLFTPGLFVVVPMWRVFVWPKMQVISVDLEVAVPYVTWFVSTYATGLMIAYACALLFFCGVVFLYLGKPELFGSSGGSLRHFRDSLLWRIPWARKRALRNFSLMLGTFLDAGVPEEQALRLAGQCTANTFFTQRVQKSIDKLRQGVSLMTAVETLDSRGELSWRLANAAHRQRDFVRSLQGWHEMLESKAFQSEQTAAHILTSAFVILNGAFVAVFVCSVFMMLIAVINEGVLW